MIVILYSDNFKLLAVIIMCYCVVIEKTASRVQREDWLTMLGTLQKNVKNGHINGSEVCNNLVIG